MEDLTGKQFGHYQIVASLGEGGMAAVYKAYQPSMERYVAIKVLPRQMAVSDQFLARFKLEAKLLAQLQHPHILPVFDYGEAEGYTYIVMTYVKSGTLADLMKKRRFSLAEIREIISQVGGALGYAHSSGMIHRDVKPSNVLVDESGNCLLTDFGLARMIESTSNLTSSGTIMGTPAYMSPEQGAGVRIDKRSDIYSLGIILFELLTGRVPYTAETPVAVVFKHIQDPLPSVRKLNPNLSTEIEMVLYKALAKNPEDRYQTVEDFVRALQQVDVSEKLPIENSEQEAPEEAESLAAEQSTREQSERESAEKIAREQAKHETTEKIAREQAEREAVETAAPAQSRSSFGVQETNKGYGSEDRKVPVSSYQGPVSSQKIPQKSNSYIGILTVIAVVVFCVIAAGLTFVGYQVISSAQTAQQGTATAESMAAAPSQSISTATAAANLTGTAVVKTTATARAKATEVANANATATEMAIHASATAAWKQASAVDQFKDNSGKWITPSFDANNEYWSGFGSIANGIYQYKVSQTRKPFAYWVPYNGMTSDDFDLSVAARRVGGIADQVCYGLYFRAISEKKYVFAVCDSQHYSVEYFDGAKFNTLRDWSKSTAIKQDDWNVLWVSARKNVFTLYINDVKVDTITNASLQSGWTGLFFEVFNSDTPTIQFDNFSFIKR
jgi:serine/threonine protein kinase